MPAIVDVPTGQVVDQRLRPDDPGSVHAVDGVPPPGAPDLYPEALRDEIDEVNDVVFRDVNNGVYRCGFAGTQEAYDTAFDRLFDRLDWLTDRLRHRAYLVGDTITEADVRLFTTLARFDAVYHGHFKCNRASSPRCRCSGRTPETCSRLPGFGDTIDFVQIKQHYYLVHTTINPSADRARRARPGRTGSSRTVERSWAAGHSVTEQRHPRRPWTKCSRPVGR